MIPQIIYLITGFIFGLLLGMIAYQEERLKTKDEQQGLKIENSTLKEINDFYRKELGLEDKE